MHVDEETDSVSDSEDESKLWLQLESREHSRAETCLYCFKLPGFQVYIDGKGDKYYLVKVGQACMRRGSSSTNVQKVTQSRVGSAICRFRGHANDSGWKQVPKPRIPLYANDLYLGKKTKNVAFSKMLISDLQKAENIKNQSFDDFCCILNASDEQRMKSALHSLRKSDLRKLKKKYAPRFDMTTEVRLMHCKDFRRIQKRFAQGEVFGLERFEELLQRSKIYSPKAEIYVNKKGQEDFYWTSDSVVVDTLELPKVDY